MEIGTAHISLRDALALGPPPAGNLAVPVFAKGSLTVELYTPRERDEQQAHTRDEVSVVARGLPGPIWTTTIEEMHRATMPEAERQTLIADVRALLDSRAASLGSP